MFNLDTTKAPWAQIAGRNRCPRGGGDTLLGPSTFSSVMTGLLVVGTAYIALNRLGAYKGSVPKYALLLVLGALDVVAFVAYFLRYRHCDALTGWMFHFIVSSLVMGITISLGIEAEKNIPTGPAIEDSEEKKEKALRDAFKF